MQMRQCVSLGQMTAAPTTIVSTHMLPSAVTTYTHTVAMPTSTRTSIPLVAHAAPSTPRTVTRALPLFGAPCHPFTHVGSVTSLQRAVSPSCVLPRAASPLPAHSTDLSLTNFGSVRCELSPRAVSNVRPESERIALVEDGSARTPPCLMLSSFPDPKEVDGDQTPGVSPRVSPTSRRQDTGERQTQPGVPSGELGSVRTPALRKQSSRLPLRSHSQHRSAQALPQRCTPQRAQVHSRSPSPQRWSGQQSPHTRGTPQKPQVASRAAPRPRRAQSPSGTCEAAKDSKREPAAQPSRRLSPRAAPPKPAGSTSGTTPAARSQAEPTVEIVSTEIVNQAPGESLHISTHTIAGLKASSPRWRNQDRLLVQELTQNQVLLGVFDGHGQHGHHIAQQAVNIFERLAPGLFVDGTVGGAAGAFLKLFSLCQEELECDTRSRLSGTTAVCALLDLDRRTVVVAHTGDSKMVVASGDIVLETSDHRWDRDAEVRVLNRGGEVRNEWGCDRIFAQGVDWPGLAMSRSLGDVAGNQLGVSAEPEVTEELPLSVGSALVLGSDGLWDMVSPNFAVRKLRTVDEADHAAYTLVTTARQRWPAGEDIDDITAVTALLISQEVGSATEESR